MVSGKTKDYLFKPSDSAGDIAQFIFDNWPEGKFTQDQVWEKLKVYKQRKIWLLLPKNFKELYIQKKRLHDVQVILNVTMARSITKLS